MKVFALMYYNYDDTDFYGVFKTLEAAEKARDNIVEESEMYYRNIFGEKEVIYGKKPDYFDISEEEVKE